MSEDLTPEECPECARLRKAYWRAIHDSVRLEKLLTDRPEGPERGKMQADYAARERIRIDVRDIFLKHKHEAHGR